MKKEKETILVVEDDSAIRESLQEILEVKGYGTLIAKNGKDGLVSIIKEKPSLVICDVNMPEMGGFELLSMLNKSMDKEIVPPFLFLTANTDMSSIREGMDLGAEDYLLKPYNHIKLLNSVESKLDKRKLIKSQAVKIEQDRISHELHDNIQQLLAAAQMGFGSLEKRMWDMNVNEQKIYTRSMDFLKEATGEIRNISHGLSNLAEIDLKDKMRILLKQLQEAGKIETNFSYTGTNNLKNSEKIELLRIIQEAVTNTIKYGQAKKVDITIEASESSGKLKISDDGKGFNIENLQKGNGLMNMKKRAEKIGASFKIESTPEKGTSILLVW